MEESIWMEPMSKGDNYREYRKIVRLGLVDYVHPGAYPTRDRRWFGGRKVCSNCSRPCPPEPGDECNPLVLVQDDGEVEEHIYACGCVKNYCLKSHPHECSCVGAWWNYCLDHQ